MNETIHTEEAYGRAMAQVARAENDRLARVMSGETMARMRDAFRSGHGSSEGCG